MATDVENGGNLTYSIASGNTHTDWAISSAGVITTANTLAASTTGGYSLVLNAADSSLTETATVWIVVTSCCGATAGLAGFITLDIVDGFNSAYVLTEDAFQNDIIATAPSSNNKHCLTTGKYLYEIKLTFRERKYNFSGRNQKAYCSQLLRQYIPADKNLLIPQKSEYSKASPENNMMKTKNNWYQMLICTNVA
ncbi:uncharacterized protein LOC128550599 [Mercenaria mercenaria]|uniref:uncharacterized protein LOC128550599 n=1 Tax=Mercenaria mercenaria TaxID=6596 RepID=UPI00234F206F|nr:uncharacterized protein LOC128550599 [Mercenaria mercenaria]